jgi:hypothetical protein
MERLHLSAARCPCLSENKTCQQVCRNHCGGEIVWSVSAVGKKVGGEEMNYEDFLRSKIPVPEVAGFAPDTECPAWFKPHQSDCCHWAIPNAEPRQKQISRLQRHRVCRDGQDKKEFEEKCRNGWYDACASAVEADR